MLILFLYIHVNIYIYRDYVIYVNNMYELFLIYYIFSILYMLNIVFLYHILNCIYIYNKVTMINYNILLLLYIYVDSYDSYQQENHWEEIHNHQNLNGSPTILSDIHPYHFVWVTLFNLTSNCSACLRQKRVM